MKFARKSAVWLALALMAATAAVGAVHAAADAFGYYSMQGQYKIYGGAIGDPVAPSAKDRKIAFYVTGNVARDMFNSMGPDTADVCGPTAKGGSGVRRRDNVYCATKEGGGYRCNFGFDLRTGKSLLGISC